MKFGCTASIRLSEVITYPSYKVLLYTMLVIIVIIIIIIIIISISISIIITIAMFC